MEVPQEIKIKLLYGPSSPLLHIYIYEGNKVTMLSEIRQILHDIIYMWNIKKTH